MAEAAPQPRSSESMEDILQSIKRIIEDDAGEEEPKTGPKVPEAAVLELTQVVDDGGPSAAPSPLPVPPAAAEPAVSAVPAPPPSSPPAPALKPVKMEDGLVSDQAAEAAVAALKTIGDNAQKDYSIPRIASPELRGGSTVEDLLLEALRPMLKAWLDEHLPGIVQKIVEKEVKRIAAFYKD